MNAVITPARTSHPTSGAAHRLSGATEVVPRRPSRPLGWWPGATFSAGASTTMSVGSAEFARADMPAEETLRPWNTNGAVRVALLTSAADLERVVALRKAVYARHERPIEIGNEAIDNAPRTAVLGAFDRDGELFATMRVSFSEDGGDAWLDKYGVPEAYRKRRLASFERLAIDGGGMPAARAKQALFKVAFMLTLGSAVDWIVISTVAPLNRQFESFGFSSVFCDNRTIQLDWFGAPQFVLALKANDSGLSLLRANRAWYDHIVTADPVLDRVLAQYYAGSALRRAAAP